MPPPNDPLSALFRETRLSSGVFYAGTLCKPSKPYPGENRSGYLHVLRRGLLDLVEESKRHTRIDEPSIIFFPRPFDHQLLPVDESGMDLVCSEVDLGLDTNSPVLKMLPERLIIPMASVPDMKASLDLLDEEAKAQRLGYRASIDRVMEVLLIQIIRHISDTGILSKGILGGLSDIKLRLAIEAMQTQPARSWTLEELAMLAGMSRARFAARFLSVVGQPAIDYLTDWRMMVAQNLLRKGRPVKQVAAAVGYRGTPAFVRAFSRTTGMTPLQWCKHPLNGD